ncbi:MAG: hypothetical protein HUK07_06615 [Bacteroidaceae bacterium]|nr:hypothetical protein [Bacteroidaceae bacterium]
MRKLHTLLLLMLLAAGSITTSSCLGGDDTNTITYSDCVVSSFSLGTLNRYTHTTSSKGADSIVKTTVTGSDYKFHIDQQKHEIYNTDSLPSGTDSLHVLCNIAALNGGYVFIKSTQSDSLFTYSSADSISFEKNPRTIAVIANDSKSIAFYTVKLNIHKEQEQKMTWNAPYVVDKLASADRLQAIEWDGQMLVKAVKGNATTLYTTRLGDGKQWNAITPNTTLSTTANIAVCGNMLYTTDNSGNVLKSADGKQWQKVGAQTGNVVGVSNNLLYIEKSGSLLSYNINTAATTTEQLYDINSYPFAAKSYTSLCEVKSGSKTVGTTIVGSTGTASAVLYKAENTAEAQKWMLLTNETKQTLPNGVDIQAVSYGDYIIALANNKLYSSTDFGRSWQNRYYLYSPSALNITAGQAFAFAKDSNGSLWIITKQGQVFRGKYNEASWKK